MPLEEMKHVVNEQFYVPIYCVQMTMPAILIVTITIIIIIIIVSPRSACNLTFYFVLAMNTKPELLSRVGGLAGGSPLAFMSMTPGYFHRKQQENKTKRKSQLFNSPLAYCISSNLKSQQQALLNTLPQKTVKIIITVCKKVFLTLTIKANQLAFSADKVLGWKTVSSLSISIFLFQNNAKFIESHILYLYLLL